MPWITRDLSLSFLTDTDCKVNGGHTNQKRPGSIQKPAVVESKKEGGIAPAFFYHFWKCSP
jgi:hypothetical protein